MIGIDTKRWKKVWDLLFIIAKVGGNRIFDVLKLCTICLPCDTCSINLRQHLKNKKIMEHWGNDGVKFLWILKNEINQNYTGQPTLEMVRKRKIYFSINDFWDIFFLFCITANTYEKKIAFINLFLIIIECNIIDGIRNIVDSTIHLINYSSEKDLMNYFIILRYYYDGKKYDHMGIYEEYISLVHEF